MTLTEPVRSVGAAAALHHLPAVPETMRWGHFDHAIPPALTVASGDLLAVETLTHHAGDAPDLLMDDGIRAVFAGVTDRGPGPHLLTGPIAVEGARPGDVLEVRILDARPRLAYGCNWAGTWGHLHAELGRERATIFRIDEGSGLAKAVFAYDFPGLHSPQSVGVLVEPGAVDREPALDGVAIPLRPHFGTMGVAPAAPGRHSSVPPGDHGGNVDNWRTGAGATMYYPVQVPGALLSVGDPHVSQGDGEVSGTALEASLDGLLQLTVRRDLAFRFPVLETATTWSVHGFGDTLDAAMKAASLRMLEFLGLRYGLSQPDAYALMSVAADFVVTQVVDARQGVHATVEKRIFIR